MDTPAVISLAQWAPRYAALRERGLREPSYGGPLQRHADDGDLRLASLTYDNSAAALRLWNFLLSEEERLHQARAAGRVLVGTMKDLGTVPVIAYAFDHVTAFYPDGAWWTPCLMLQATDVLAAADAMGLGECMCPVRAMAGAFATGGCFPIPDFLVCSVGAVCDDFSAIAQRVEALGHPILWWEMPPRRRPEVGEPTVPLPSGFTAAASQVALVRDELRRIAHALEQLTGQTLDDAKLSRAIARANHVRRVLCELSRLAYTADPCPLPALELLIAQMLAIHFCSDADEAPLVLEDLLDEVRQRVAAGVGVLDRAAVKVFWVNPVADLRVMNLLEQLGGRVTGSDYMIGHALDAIPTDIDPWEALARIALGDPMVGWAADRAQRIAHDIRALGSEAVVVSRIPGASHCAYEGDIIAQVVRRELGLPVLEIEVPSLSDALRPTLTTRLEALMETAQARRRS
jgi:benzoyl-CoA reductase/2-hydroxyglutaryl-CoA dehydratase subunit BcrC/BadD/HgdB